jgi:hypothetical protein
MGNDFWTPERLDALRSLATEPVRIRISGDCMAPRLRHGARVWVRSQRHYWPGDVLVLRSQSAGLVAHRLIGAYRRGGVWRWLSQSDQAWHPDCAVSLQQIVGRVCGGECAPELVSVPLGHRVSAVVRFVRFAVRRSMAPRKRRIS